MNTKVQDTLRQQGWSGYILPCRDSFLSSSDMARQRIARLTGFTGSTSTVFLTHEKTYLFVDSRYTVQATQQAPECEVITCHSPLQEISDLVSSGDKIALNPWLFSIKEINSYQEHLDRQGVHLCFDTESIVDKIISPHTELYTAPIKAIESDRSFQDKCQFVFGRSLERPFLLCKAQDIAWLTNLRGRDCTYSPIFYSYLVVTYEEDKYKGLIFTYLPRSIKCADPDISFLTCEDLADYLKGQPLFYDPDSTPYRLHRLSGTQWQEGSLSKLAHTRARKTAWEKHHMEHVHIKDGVAVTRFLYALSRGESIGHETEFSAAQQIEEERKKHPSYEGPSFSTISAFGDHTALIHYTPPREGSRVLKEGFYLIDSGGQYRFGTTDITRTVWLGQTPSLRHQRLYTMVLQAHIHLASLVFPVGTHGVHLDAAARSFLWQQGLDYPHSTGHGVGCYLNVHEFPPALSPRLHEGIIEEGMIFSNEPGYYEQGWGGIRLENVVAVETRDSKLGLNTLSLAPFDRKLILEDELSGAHKRWLNSYHQRVYTTLSPLLEPSVRSWLYESTRPL